MKNIETSALGDILFQKVIVSYGIAIPVDVGVKAFAVPRRQHEQLNHGVLEHKEQKFQKQKKTLP